MLVSAALLIFATCGGGQEPFVDTCPNDVPDACPAVPPSYAADVAPLLHDRCGACHTVDGLATVYPYDTYEQVKAQRLGILSQLHSCLMPPADQPQPTAAERQTIFSWLVCGAMNN
ncbi:MAG: hypothetical protein ABI560_10710 [Myxococcales bacterium]